MSWNWGIFWNDSIWCPLPGQASSPGNAHNSWPAMGKWGRQSCRLLATLAGGFCPGFPCAFPTKLLGLMFLVVYLKLNQQNLITTVPLLSLLFPTLEAIGIFKVAINSSSIFLPLRKKKKERNRRPLTSLKEMIQTKQACSSSWTVYIITWIMLNFTHMLGKGWGEPSKNNYCEFKLQMNGASLIHKCHMKLWLKRQVCHSGDSSCCYVEQNGYKWVLF